MAYPRSRRRSRGHRHAADRRGSAPNRTPLADDVPPAFLARLRHRPLHRHLGHRHRAVGYRRQNPRRALSQALGRPRARFHPPLLPSRRRTHGGLLRNRPGRTPQRFADLAAPGGCERLFRIQERWPCRQPCAGGHWRRSARPSSASPPCAKPSGRRSTSWSTATPAPRRPWACSSPRPWSPTAFTFSRNPAGRSPSTALRQHPTRRAYAHRHRRAPDGISASSGNCSRPAAATSRSPTSPIAAACPRRGRSRRWPRPIVSRWHRTIRRARSAPPPRSSSDSRSPTTSSARPSARMSRGAPTWYATSMPSIARRAR